MSATAFVKAPKSVLARADIKPAAKLLYFAIVDQMYGGDDVSIGEAGLRKMTGLGHRAIIRARQDLLDARLLIAENTAPAEGDSRRGSGKRCTYRRGPNQSRNATGSSAQTSARTQQVLTAKPVPERNRFGATAKPKQCQNATGSSAKTQQQ